MRSMPLAATLLLAAAPFVVAQAQTEPTPPAPPPAPAPAPAAPAPEAKPAAPTGAPSEAKPAAPTGAPGEAKPAAAPGGAAATTKPAAGAPGAPGTPAAPAANPITRFAATKKSACVVRALPLTPGNQWTYIGAPASRQLDQREAAQVPKQPEKVILTVTDSVTNAGVTTVTLEEQSFLAEKEPPRVLTTTITCSQQKFDIPVESFLFSGEPGGYWGLEMTNITRKGTTWALQRGLLPDLKWREDLIITWKRVGVAGSGKLEMEREIVPQDRQQVTTPAGVFNAEPLAIITTGRVFVDGATAGAEPYPFKEGMTNTLWVMDGIGLVQAENSFMHRYVLLSAKLAR